MEKIVIVTGGFDPVHSGHVEYFQEASAFGRVIVGLNSDEWLINKKGKFFISWDERKVILEEMRSVWAVVGFEDDEKGSACGAIRKVKQMFPEANIYFANGGDRVLGGDVQVSSEEVLCEELGIEVIYGVGQSGKIQSSSSLLKTWTDKENGKGD